MGLFALLLGCASAATGQPHDAPGASKLRVYVGTYTNAGKSRGIYLLELDPSSGALTPRGLAGEAVNPSFLAIHPTRRFLYAVGEVSDYQGRKDGAVASFAVDAKTGALTLLNQQSSRGAGPCYVALDRLGKNALVANYGGGSVAVLPIREDGTLGEASAFVQHGGTVADPKRQGGPHAHSINLDAANRFAVAADLGLDELLVYRFDADRGSLTPNDPPFARVAPRSGPRHFAFHPDGRHAYVINEISCTVTAFDYDPARGTLTEIQTISTLPEGEPVRKGYSTAAHRGASLGPVPVRVEPGPRQHRDLRDRRRDRPAHARRPPADRGEDAAELRHRPDGGVPAGRQPGLGHRRRLPHRSAGPAASSRPGRRPRCRRPSA